MKRTALGFCVVSLFAVVAAAGCSSSGGPVSGSSGGSNGNGSGGNSSSGGSNGNGSGGNSSSGGSNGSGSGGSESSGSGGSSSGSGGSSSGSGGSTVACANASGALISDFAGSGGQVGAPYTGADTGLTVPKATIADGALAVDVDTGTATTDYPWAFAAVAFNGCVNASTYTNVTFNISGTLSEGCTIQFSTVDKEHNLVKDGGSCAAASCYPSAKVFTLPSSATDVTVNFADQTGGGADASALVVDPSQIMAVQWQINIPKAGSCKGTVKIDNVTFK